MKRLFVGVATAAMVFTMLGTNSIYAEGEDTKNVDVAYDNSDVIVDPDPDAPTDGKWGVKVPTAIEFTDRKKEVSAPVELVGLLGYDILTLGMDVNVTVTSANSMKMVYDGDNVDYTLKYGETTMSGTSNTATINLTSASKETTISEGKAVMTGNATKKGLHKDVLTYVVAAN